MDGDPGADLIGRDPECAHLVAAVVADRPAWVVGEPGIGKTTLVRAAAVHTGRRLHEGEGIATLGSAPYQALPRAFAATLAGDAEQVAAEVERMVGPDILFMDDAQWADHDSRRIVARLAGRIAVVVASREEPDGELAAVPWVRVEVRSLDDAPAAAIARRLRPGLSAARVAGIVERAAGNPLLVEELARDGSESPTMRRALGARLKGLPADERHVLWLLALAGRPVSVDRLTAGVDALTARGLVSVREGEAHVRHALLRDEILSLVPKCERAALCLELAGLFDDPLEAAGLLLQAGDAAGALAVAEPALVDAAGTRGAALLEIAAAGSSGPRADEYRLEAARAYSDLGDDAAVVRLLREPMGGDAETMAWRAALLGEGLWSMGMEEEARRVLEEAPRRWPPTTPGDLELEVTRARQLVYTGHPGPALKLLDDVLTAAGTQPSAYRLMSLRAAVALFSGQVGAVELLRDAWAEARRVGDEAMASTTARYLHNGFLLEVGASEAATFTRQEGARLEVAGLPALGAAHLAEAVQALTLAGDLAAAIELGDQLAERPTSVIFRQRAHLYQAHALTLAGRFEEAAQVRRLLKAPFPSPTQEADRLDEAAEAAYWEGRSRRCLELSSAAAMLPRESDANVVLPALVRAWAQVDSGRRPDALPQVPSFPCFAGAEPEAEGLAALAGNPGTARTRFEEAAIRWAAFMAPREAVCLWAAGAAARRAGHADAPDLLRTALWRAEAMGFEPLVARIRRSLRLLGQPAGRRAVAPRGPLPLTARERQVLDLVGLGLTNTEIARRMGLGRPTVAQALSRAMARLGVDSRAQAVAAGGASAPPLIVMDDHPGSAGWLAEIRTALVGSGWHVMDGFGPDVRRPAVLAGTVDGEAAAAAAMLAALEGHGLLVLATCPAETTGQLVADLRRVGQVTHHPAPGGTPAGVMIGSCARALLTMVADGHSVTEAASILGISRRTADRRLGEVRDALGVTTTAGAVGEATRRGWLPRPAR